MPASMFTVPPSFTTPPLAAPPFCVNVPVFDVVTAPVNVEPAWPSTVPLLTVVVLVTVPPAPTIVVPSVLFTASTVSVIGVVPVPEFATVPPTEPDSVNCPSPSALASPVMLAWMSAVVAAPFTVMLPFTVRSLPVTVRPLAPLFTSTSPAVMPPPSVMSTAPPTVSKSASSLLLKVGPGFQLLVVVSQFWSVAPVNVCCALAGAASSEINMVDPNAVARIPKARRGCNAEV